MSYFPLKIQEIKSGKVYIVDTPEQIPNGVTFTVLECNAVDEPMVIEGAKHA